MSPQCHFGAVIGKSAISQFFFSDIWRHQYLKNNNLGNEQYKARKRVASPYDHRSLEGTYCIRPGYDTVFAY